MPLTDAEIRLRILELALLHAHATDKVAAALEFEVFVFGPWPTAESEE